MAGECPRTLVASHTRISIQKPCTRLLTEIAGFDSETPDPDPGGREQRTTSFLVLQVPV